MALKNKRAVRSISSKADPYRASYGVDKEKAVAAKVGLRATEKSSQMWLNDERRL